VYFVRGHAWAVYNTRSSVRSKQQRPEALEEAGLAVDGRLVLRQIADVFCGGRPADSAENRGIWGIWAPRRSQCTQGRRDMHCEGVLAAAMCVLPKAH
jgi:hypothetical protein